MGICDRARDAVSVPPRVREGAAGVAAEYQAGHKRLWSKPVTPNLQNTLSGDFGPQAGGMLEGIEKQPFPVGPEETCRALPPTADDEADALHPFAGHGLPAG